MTPHQAAQPFPTYFGAFPDPATVAVALLGIDVEMDPERPVEAVDPRLHSSLARGTLGPLNVAVGRFGVGIPQAHVTRDTHTFVFPTEASIVRRVSGQLLSGRQIIHLRPNAPTASTSPAGMPWAFGLINAPLGQLALDAPRVAGMDTRIPLDEDRIFTAPGREMTRLIAVMKDVARVIRDTPWVTGAPAAATALGGSVMTALLACLTEGVVRPDRAALRRHRQIVMRFEDALRERPEEMLSLSAICGAVGVAARTLNLACQEFLGEGPMQYARGRRLDLVRLRLLASDPARTQVTSVAMHYGFWELSRFAQAYRRRFGERPSETLRRDGAPAGLR